MTISARQWDEYIRQMRKVNDTAAEIVRKYIVRNGIPGTRDATDALIRYAYSVSTTLGEAAAALAAEMYDAIALASAARVPPAAPAATPTMNEVAKTVVGTMKTGNEEIISAAVGRLVKQTGVDTTMQNALRDGAEWAWIPRGDTCPFCIMLASNGWQRASRKAIKSGHAEHIHANCDCTYAVRFDSFSRVAGYDPDKYFDMFSEAEGRTWEDKLNSMRREAYAKNSEEINAQKRSAYEKRKERESSAAEEIDV